MTVTDIHCPSCGHHLFKADIGALTENLASPAVRIGSGTEVAVALLVDFLNEQSRLVRAVGGRALQSDVIAAFNQWATERGSTPQSASAIGRGLRELGIEPVRSNGQRFYRGLAFAHGRG